MRNFRPYFILIAIIMFMSFFSMNRLPAQYESKKQPSQDSESYARDADEKDGATKKEEPAELKNPAHLTDREARVNKLCPVDFKKIRPDARYPYTYKDKIYFFHSPKCIEEFKKDPEGYLKAWEKKERFYKINIIYD